MKFHERTYSIGEGKTISIMTTTTTTTMMIKQRCKRRFVVIFLGNLAYICSVWLIQRIEASFGVAVVHQKTTASWILLSTRNHDYNNNKHQHKQQRQQQTFLQQQQRRRTSLGATKQNDPPPPKKDADEGKKGFFGIIINMWPFGKDTPPPPPSLQEKGFKIFFKKEEESFPKQSQDAAAAAAIKDERKRFELRQRAQAERQRRLQEIQQQRDWFSWNQTKIDDDDDDEQATSEGDNGKNPLSVAQRFFGNVWDSTVGGLRTAPKEEWIVLCPKTRIAPGEIVPVVAAGLDLLVIASKDGRKVHCIANSCPHLGTPLETGTLERRPLEGSVSSSSSSVVTLQESDVAAMLAEDGCEDCIVCPLHHTAFALESGQVRGEWCPYPPILGSIMGSIKPKTAVAVFDIRTKGKNIEVRINSILLQDGDGKETITTTIQPKRL